MSVRRRLVAAATFLALLGADAAVAEAQCSMCRTLLATPEGQRVADGLRSGIWILLGAPIGVFAAIAFAAVKSRRRIETFRTTSSQASARSSR